MNDATSQADLEENKKSIMSMRKPIVELMGAVKAATRELSQARDAALKPKSKGKGKGRGKGRGKAGEEQVVPSQAVTDGSVLMRLAADSGLPLPEMSVQDPAMYSMSTPMLMLGFCFFLCHPMGFVS
eukprot:4709734-Pyramimonas_sp.AAC.1